MIWQATSRGPRSATTNNQECKNAAQRVLGTEAEVLECGQLSLSGELEVLAAIRLKGFKDTELGIPVSKFIVLRKDKPEWVMELIADQKPVRNNAGYVGVTDIDDTDDYSRYRLSVEGEEVNAKEPLCLLLRYIDPDGKTEAWPLEICWNPAVKRFQEYSEDIPPEFKSEIQNPKHFRSKGR
jgi:hypothetical protein